MIYSYDKEVVYLSYSKAQMEANHRYREKAYDQYNLTLPKGKREVYKAQAADRGMSLNAYIISLLEADKAKYEPVD